MMMYLVGILCRLDMKITLKINNFVARVCFVHINMLNVESVRNENHRRQHTHATFTGGVFSFFIYKTKTEPQSFAIVCVQMIHPCSIQYWNVMESNTPTEHADARMVDREKK